MQRGIARRVSRQLHRWLGIGLLVLLLPLAVSGLYLMFDEDIDSILNPSRYATTSGAPVASSVLIARAQEAVGAGFIPVSLRLPEAAGDVAVATLREAQASGRRARTLTVYLDPSNGRAPDVVNQRQSLYGTMHLMHEHLMVPEYSGRTIVGWAGLGMLLLSITGVVIWWPRNGAWRRAFRWQRTTDGYSNLHHFFGFWIALPLAVVSATGIFLAFPQQSRDMVRSVAPMAPSQRGGALIAVPTMSIDAVIARAATAGRVTQVNYPAQSTSAWRVEVTTPAGNETMQLVDDKSGALAAQAAPLTGDSIIAWMWWIHEGSHAGPVWRAIVIATGILPIVFAVTGLVIWYRLWRVRRMSRSRARAGLTAAAE